MQRTQYNRPLSVTRDRHGHVPPVEEASIGDLLRQLTADSSHLVKQQFELAKTELKETTTHLSQTAAQIGIALAIALPGVMALGAFLVVGLGEMIDNYWASALIVGIVLCATAALVFKRALDNTRRADVGLDDTKRTLREDAQWAKHEIRAFKRELTS